MQRSMPNSLPRPSRYEAQATQMLCYRPHYINRLATHSAFIRGFFQAASRGEYILARIDPQTYSAPPLFFFFPPPPHRYHKGIAAGIAAAGHEEALLKALCDGLPLSGSSADKTTCHLRVWCISVQNFSPVLLCKQVAPKFCHACGCLPPFVILPQPHTLRP